MNNVGAFSLLWTLCNYVKRHTKTNTSLSVSLSLSVLVSQCLFLSEILVSILV